MRSAVHNGIRSDCSFCRSTQAGLIPYTPKSLWNDKRLEASEGREQEPILDTKTVKLTDMKRPTKGHFYSKSARFNLYFL
jgi:hypothetical protein